MAKTPGTPKAKTAAPAQFDMNSRERKGGGKGGPGGPGGPGRNRDEKRPPARVVSLPPTLVDRGEGWIIQKLGKVDQASHAPVGAEYHLTFEGHEPLVFAQLGAARDRSKEPAPEIVAVAEPVAEEASAEEPGSDEAGHAEADAGHAAEATHEAEAHPDAPANEPAAESTAEPTA